MKKLSKIFICLSLVLASCFTLIGCGGNPPPDNQEQTPQLAFDDYFGFAELTTYSGGVSCVSIDELSQYATYSTVTLYAKRDITFNHFGFKISSESSSDEMLYATVKFGTMATWHSVSTYAINTEKTCLDCYYVKGSVSGSKYFVDDYSNPNLSISNYSILKNTEVKIYFGTKAGVQISPASEGYTTPIKLTDFVIE